MWHSRRMAENELPTDYNLCEGREITPTGDSMRKQKKKVQNYQTRTFLLLFAPYFEYGRKIIQAARSFFFR